MADPALAEDVQGAIAYAMPFPVPEKTVRINITIEEALLRQIDLAASVRDQSRSGFLAEAAKASIFAATRSPGTSRLRCVMKGWKK